MTDQHQRHWRAPAAVLVAVLAIVLVVTGGFALLTDKAPRPSFVAPTFVNLFDA